MDENLVSVSITLVLQGGSSTLAMGHVKTRGEGTSRHLASPSPLISRYGVGSPSHWPIMHTISFDLFCKDHQDKRLVQHRLDVAPHILLAQG